MFIRLYQFLVVTCTLVGLACAAPAADQFAARVVSVDDGDSLRVSRNGEEVRVRLYGIDAPENGQAYGRDARDLARRLLLNQTVTVSVRDVDQYGRLVATLSVDGKDVGTTLVAAGAAWHYTAHSNDRALADAEAQARRAKVGLWAASEQTPPWEYRVSTSPRTPDRPPAASARSGALHGNRNSRVYHAAGCEQYECPSCTVVFESAADARAAGFRPHASCTR